MFCRDVTGIVRVLPLDDDVDEMHGGHVRSIHVYSVIVSRRHAATNLHVQPWIAGGHQPTTRLVSKAMADIQTYNRLAAINEAPAAAMPSVTVPSARSPPRPTESGWINECQAAYRDAQAATARFGASLRSVTDRSSGHIKVPSQDPQVVTKDPPLVAGASATAAPGATPPAPAQDEVMPTTIA